MTNEADPRPMLEVLLRLQKTGETMLSNPKVTRGSLQMYTQSVRAQLAKIYGKEASQLAYFLPVDSDFSEQHVRSELQRRIDQVRQFIKALEALPKATLSPSKRVFIGHGRSDQWRVLKDFLADRLKLPWDEFNREAVAGYTTSERLESMMIEASFAFLIMTAEEEHADTLLHARPNVVHEVGLFQGRLGLRRAIVLLEEGCSEFSNIIGLSQIRFPQGDIAGSIRISQKVFSRFLRSCSLLFIDSGSK